MRGVRSLLESANLRRLTHLSLGKVDPAVISVLDCQVKKSLPLLRHLAVSCESSLAFNDPLLRSSQEAAGVDLATSLGQCQNLPDQLHSLNLLHSSLGDKGLNRLMLQNWPRVQNLGLSANLTEEGSGVWGMRHCGWLSNLKTLDLSWNPLGADALSVLGELPLDRLEHLDLEESGQEPYERTFDGVIEQWCHEKSFPSLVSLSLSGGRVTDEGLRYVSESSFGSRVKSLKIGSLNKSGFIELAKGGFPQLKNLIVTATLNGRIDEECLRVLSNSDKSGNLVKIELTFVDCGEHGLRYFFDSQKFVALSHLRLHDCNLRDATAALADAAPGGIRVLDLSANNLHLSNVEEIVAADPMKSVFSLDLSHNGRLQECGSVLINAKNLRNLIWLSVRECGMPGSDVQDMMRAEHLPLLGHVDWSQDDD